MARAEIVAPCLMYFLKNLNQKSCLIFDREKNQNGPLYSITMIIYYISFHICFFLIINIIKIIYLCWKSPTWAKIIIYFPKIMNGNKNKNTEEERSKKNLLFFCFLSTDFSWLIWFGFPQVSSCWNSGYFFPSFIL